MKSSDYWIEKLCLQKHPEGGYFREIYRSSEKISKSNLPVRFRGDRCFSTSIYFLLQHPDVSAFHRIKQEEIWHFYNGTSLIIYEITKEAELKIHLLGDDFEKGERFQVIISAESWFAAKVNQSGSFALVGCTVAPGFDFDDFELADINQLYKLYPQFENIIKLFKK